MIEEFFIFVGFETGDNGLFFGGVLDLDVVADISETDVDGLGPELVGDFDVGVGHRKELKLI